MITITSAKLTAGAEAVVSTADNMEWEISIRASPVLQNDALNDVGGVLAAVDGGFHELEEFLPLDDVQRIGAGLEQFGDCREVVVVSDVFQAVDFDDFGLKIGELA